MNIYHVERIDDNLDYDEYSDFVAIANNETEARRINPGKHISEVVTEEVEPYASWVKFSQTRATLIGTALLEHETKVICASFHAG